MKTKKKPLTAKQKQALILAKELMIKFDIGHIAPGSHYSDFGWTQATLLEVAAFLHVQFRK